MFLGSLIVSIETGFSIMELDNFLSLSDEESLESLLSIRDFRSPSRSSCSLLGGLLDPVGLGLFFNVGPVADPPGLLTAVDLLKLNGLSPLDALRRSNVV